MKEVHMLLGLGVGLVAGAMLYKYSRGAQKLVNQGEKAIMKEANMLEKKAEDAAEQLGKKVKQGAKKIEKKMQEKTSQK